MPLATIDLAAVAATLPQAWRSRVVGHAAGANLKVCVVPAGQPHAVALGSHDTLLIIDR